MDRSERSIIGRNSRKAGKRFENDVMHDLESKGWIVARWTKKVENGELVNNKPKFNPFTKRIQSLSTGFPDFILIKFDEAGVCVQLLECKLRGKLDKAEKEQIRVLNSLGFVVTIAEKTDDGIQYKQALADS